MAGSGAPAREVTRLDGGSVLRMVDASYGPGRYSRLVLAMILVGPRSSRCRGNDRYPYKAVRWGLWGAGARRQDGHVEARERAIPSMSLDRYERSR
jgi:hypothetical protein